MISAENDTEAKQVALINAEKEISQYGKTEIIEVRKPEDLPKDWIDQIPYNKALNETETCGTILNKIIASNPEKKIEEVTRAPNIARKSTKKALEKPLVIDKGLETIKPTTTTTTTTTTTEAKKEMHREVSTISPATLPKLRF